MNTLKLKNKCFISFKYKIGGYVFPEGDFSKFEFMRDVLDGRKKVIVIIMLS